MNKKLIAMAVGAALAAPMAANAGVTVYGHLQVEVASVTNDGYGENNTGGVRTGIAANESGIKMKDNKRGRLGFKVSEDLGGGLKGIAKFEWQIDTPNGNIADGAREGWVGLKGGWGEFKAGRIKTPYKYTGGGAYGQNSFWNQSISYKNKWGGFSLWIDYGLDEGDGAGASAGSGGTMGAISAAVKYGAKNWEVFAAYNSADGNVNGSGSTIATTGNDRTVTKFGGQIKFAGAHTISAQYEMDDPGTTTADATYYALGVIHKFSKKTRAFVGYRNTDGDAANNDLSVFSAGLRVDF